MKSEVLKWIGSGCNPEHGVRLLEAHCKNRYLVRIVKLDPAKNLHLILRELTKLANISSEASPELPTQKQSGQSSFREEFPFLNNSDCPIELKALVTDKFSSFYQYRKLHSQLWDCINRQECADLARNILSNYQENRLIYSELDYYKRHGVILGKHPIFKHYNKVAGLRKLSIKELIIRQIQLEHNIWRIESELKKKNKPHLNDERQVRLEQKKAELAEVNRLIS